MTYTGGVPGAEEIWFPLVDGPIGSIVDELQSEDPEIVKLVDSPRRLLAFRAFASIRVGVVLGRLLVENDVPEYDGTETWVEALLREPRHRQAVAAELRMVADEIARDDAEDVPLGPDDDARARFRDFARKQLS
jgi:hypothetical protein